MKTKVTEKFQLMIFKKQKEGICPILTQQLNQCYEKWIPIKKE